MNIMTSLIISECTVTADWKCNLAAELSLYNTTVDDALMVMQLPTWMPFSPGGPSLPG